MQKEISFVNTNFKQGPSHVNAYYLPYSTGVLWAYAKNNPDISKNFKLGHFIFKRDNVYEVAQRLKNNSVVCFSTYVWNKRYNYKLAKLLKEQNPNVLIIFGGPEVPITHVDIFKKFPFIDIAVNQEGEPALERILLNYPNDYTHIPGLVINKNGESVNTGPNTRIDNLGEVPSPYLSGVFDQLILDNPGIEWNATLETNRGCPYHCTFCDWGSLTYSKVKKFDLQRVFDELEWFGKHKCGHLYITDANFGMFIERDMDVIKKLVDVQLKYGYPKNYALTWAKNQRQEVIDIIKYLSQNGQNRTALNLSVQTLDENVLSIIRRQNLATNKINEAFEECNKHNIPLFTELILGLPGETLKSWRDNFWGLYNLGNHSGVTVYQAQLLENSEMNLLQKRLYNIQTVETTEWFMNDLAGDPDLIESMGVVVSTSTLPIDDMVDASVFTWYQTSFHVTGVTSYISRVLNKMYNVSYESFYDLLWTDLIEDTWFNDKFQSIKAHFYKFLTTGDATHPPSGTVHIFDRNLMYKAVIDMQVENKVNHILDLIDEHVIKHYGDTELNRELIKFQRLAFIDFDKRKNYPIIGKFKFDFLGFLLHNNNINLPTIYDFQFNEEVDIEVRTFCELLLFARRRDYGKALILYRDE